MSVETEAQGSLVTWVWGGAAHTPTLAWEGMMELECFILGSGSASGRLQDKATPRPDCTDSPFCPQPAASYLA